ncbi:MAG: hypothetical protein RLZZ283_163 [Candidatus Parcubacteria bacterium]|jgi:hypothetical protein
MSGDHGEMYVPIFKALGLKKREVRVMRALIHLRIGRTSDIAAECSIPRQTAYSILMKLSERGLITPTSGLGIRKFMCDYGALVRFIDHERERLIEIRKSLASGSSPAPIDEQHSRLPVVTYYEGSLGLRHLFESMLDLYKRKKYTQFRGYGINFFARTFGLEEYLPAFIKKRHALGVSTKLVIAKGPDDFRITDESTRYGRKIKHLPIDEQNAGIYLTGNRTYLFSFKDNVGVMVENQAITQFLQSAFDDHWSRLKE